MKNDCGLWFFQNKCIPWTFCRGAIKCCYQGVCTRGIKVWIWFLSYCVWPNTHFLPFLLCFYCSLFFALILCSKKVGTECGRWRKITVVFISWQEDLEWDLYKNVYGQHLAQEIVSEEVAKFLQNENPNRPLVLSFHGSSGTGKTLVSSMLGNHLYGSAMSSPYVHQFIPTLHFPSPDRVKEYRVSLRLLCWTRAMLILLPLVA